MNAAPAPMAQGQQGASTQVTDNLWTIFAHNINSGACSYIEMPITLGSVLGTKGLETIAVRFRDLIQAPVVVFEDPDRALIQIMPSHHDHGHNEIILGARDPKVKTSKKAKVARPANAFILYRQHHHPLLKSQNPDLHNNQISVILGAQWNKESENTKARFVNMAKQLKARHQLEHPDYQYQPRKPSEKKRRMTQRKKAALAEASHSKPDPNLESATEAYGNAFVADEFAIPVPKLPQTLGGNAMLELGDQDLDDQTLSAMLEEYNSGRPTIQNQAANIITHCSPPVIYGEPSEEAQEQKSFYSNFHPYSSNKSLSAEMEAVMAYKQDCPAGLGPSTFQANFDEQQEYLFNAELNRMCHWNDQPAVFQP